jgi:hypothetical protein
MWFRITDYQETGLCCLEVDAGLKENWKQVREELFLRHEAETVYQGGSVALILQNHDGLDLAQTKGHQNV